VWKWKLHTGSEVEAMRTRWYGGGSEEELVECAGRRRVYTIGISPAVCGNDTNNQRHSIRVVITGKESIIRDTSHREWGRGRGDRKRSGDGSGVGGRVSERPEGAEVVRIKRKGKKGRYYRTRTTSVAVSSQLTSPVTSQGLRPDAAEEHLASPQTPRGSRGARGPHRTLGQEPSCTHHRAMCLGGGVKL